MSSCDNQNIHTQERKFSRPLYRVASNIELSESFVTFAQVRSRNVLAVTVSTDSFVLFAFVEVMTRNPVIPVKKESQATAT